MTEHGPVSKARVLPGTAAIPVMVALSAALAMAQVPQQPPRPGTAQPTIPGQPNMPWANPVRSYNGQPLLEKQFRPINSRWVTPPAAPAFTGFPTFPSRLSGYGLYPTEPGKAGEPAPRPTLPLLPAPADPEAHRGWPEWARTASKEPLPFAPDLALLVRHGDRVWLSTEPEEPFVPLFFHDKVRTLRTAAVVEVRQAGEFELLLHESTSLFARGPSRVELVEMTPAAVRLRLPALSHCRLTASGRKHAIELPDGSHLLFGDDEATTGDVLVVVERADEPDWYGGRATITNLGEVPVRWRHASGETLVVPGKRVTFFLQAPRRFVAEALTESGVQKSERGDVVQLQAPSGGTVTWCGASFVLPAGGSVTLDPQLGALVRPPEPIAEPAASPASQPAPALPFPLLPPRK